MTPETFDAYFAGLLAQYETLGLIGLGKLTDPGEGSPRTDLARTRFSIEMLQMLEMKTRGNLSEAEARELRRVLTTLRLNYIEEAKRPAATDASPPPEAAKGDAGSGAEGEGTVEGKVEGEAKEPDRGPESR
jgi:hypothetical protein